MIKEITKEQWKEIAHELAEQICNNCPGYSCDSDCIIYAKLSYMKYADDKEWLLRVMKELVYE